MAGLEAKEGLVSTPRDKGLGVRCKLREFQDKSKNQDLEYQRRLDEELKRIEEKTRAL